MSALRVASGRVGAPLTPTSLRTIHGAAFSSSAAGTEAGSTGPKAETSLMAGDKAWHVSTSVELVKKWKTSYGKGTYSGCTLMRI